MAEPGRSVLLRAVGDVALVGRAARALVERSSEDWRSTAAFLAEADITFANVEMPIPRSELARVAVDVSPDLQGDPDALPLFMDSGLDVGAVATNHIMDWGEKGLVETLDALRGSGVAVVGAGINLDEAIAPTVVERNGVRVGFCAFTPKQRWTATRGAPGAAPLKLELVKQSLAAMDRPDVRVVSVHWGLEFSRYPTPEDRRLARQIVDSGADLILGHHPHIIQGYERIGASYVVYSMGNFIFDIYAGRLKHNYDPWDLSAGYLVEARLGEDGVETFDTVPTMIGDSGVGAIAKGEVRARILEQLREASDNIDAGTAAVWEHAGGRLVGHKINAYRTTLRDGGVMAVLPHLRRVRWRHVKLLVGFLRSRLLGRRA